MSDFLFSQDQEMPVVLLFFCSPTLQNVRSAHVDRNQKCFMIFVLESQVSFVSLTQMFKDS